LYFAGSLNRSPVKMQYARQEPNLQPANQKCNQGTHLPFGDPVNAQAAALFQEAAVYKHQHWEPASATQP
jgi:hypothetical protein